MNTKKIAVLFCQTQKYISPKTHIQKFKNPLKNKNSFIFQNPMKFPYDTI